jgi:hypothetical protein
VRLPTLLPLFVATTLCSTSLALQLRPGDPAVDGKDYLISEADFRAILAVAHAEVARSHPWLELRRLSVITRDKVDVYFRDRPNPDWGDAHMLELQRSKKGWQITGHSLDRPPT